jgi:hypothetical protein
MNMRPASRSNVRHRPILHRRRIGGWLAAAALGLLVAAGPAWAQTADKTTPDVPEAKRADESPTPPAKPVVEEDLCPSKQKGKGPAVLPQPMDRSAGKLPKYRCDKPTVSVAEVWQGEQAKFTFTIANDGNADLSIKVKGG